MLLVTRTLPFSRRCQRRLAGALWPIRNNKGPLAGHSQELGPVSHQCLHTPVFIPPVLMLTKKQIFLKSSLIWFGALKTDFVLRCTFKKVPETNVKLKVLLKSLKHRMFS